MKLTNSMFAKVALMLCMPMLFEVSVIMTSIGLLNQIDASRVEKKKIGKVVYTYVDTLNAMISDYTKVAVTLEGKEKASRHELNTQFSRAQLGLDNLFKICSESGIPCRDIKRKVMRTRRRYIEGRNAPDEINSAQIERRTEAREMINDVIGIVDQRVMAKVNSLKEAEESERTLFLRMSGLLFLAFAVSVVLTVSLCLLISKMITVRIDHIRKNTERLAKGDQLLPPLRGSDEISQLDQNFHDMKDALVSADLRNQMILDNSIDLICAVDRDLQFVKVSNSSENFWQIKSEELLGRALSEFIPSDLQLSFIRNFDDARESLEVKHFEATTTAGENSLPCLWSIQWSDKDQLFICIAHDNTERKSAEARRQDLLAVISHDLRSPLTAARLSLEMLEHDKSLKAQSEHLDSASSSVNYVISVTNDLIDLLRIQQSRLTLELKLSTIAKTKELIENQMDSQGVDIDINVELSDAAYLMLDEDQLPRMIVTLAKHTRLVCGDAPVSLTITTLPAIRSLTDEDADERIIFRLEPGSQNRKDANSRVQSAKRISSEISLTLCHEIAERLQGHIYTSWTAQGLPTYELRLPAVALG